MSLATTIYHAALLKFDAESIRVFFRLYDQYEKEVRARGLQLSDHLTAVDTVRPVNLKFCVDPESENSVVAFEDTLHAGYCREVLHIHLQLTFQNAVKRC